jgi:zinc protease
VLGLTTFVHAQAVSQDPAIPKLGIEQHRLANGLAVLLVEDHRIPRVAVNLWYHVGPVNEEAGRTGFAHLFKHMMFQQSKHVSKDEFGRFLEMVGASDLNGTPDFDRTNYFETVPSNELELRCGWSRIDGYLLETSRCGAGRINRTLSATRGDKGRNQPLIVEEAMYNLFPKTHPYYGNVIGSHQTSGAKLDDVRRCRQYYSPNNATLAIVDTSTRRNDKGGREVLWLTEERSGIPAVQ